MSVHEQRQMLAAMARLDTDNDFVKFRELFLEPMLEEYVQYCIDSESPARAQGAAQVLQRILREVGEAADAFYRLSKQQEIPLA